MKRLLLVSIAVLALAGLLLASACQQAPAPTPTAAPQPKAAAPTAAPAAPTATTAAKPAAPTPAPATPAAAAAAPAKPAAQQDPPLSPPVTVKLGALDPASVSDAGIIIALEKGYFKAEGINVELVPFRSATFMIAPLSTNEIMVGGGVMSAGLFNAISRQIPLKLVADKGGLPKGFGYQGVIARKDLVDSGALKTEADLKGKTIAFNAHGNANEMTLDRILAKGGLTRKDINEQIIPAMPDIATAVANKAVDLGLLAEPLIVLAVEKGLVARWRTFDEYYPDQQLAVLMYSPEFASPANKEVANRFMVAYVKGVRDYNDAFVKGKNKQEILSIMTKRTSVKDPALYDKMGLPGLNPNGRPNEAGVADDVKYLTEKGFIKQPVDVKTVLDMQYVDYAVKRLGPYN